MGGRDHIETRNEGIRVKILISFIPDLDNGVVFFSVPDTLDATAHRPRSNIKDTAV